MSSREPLAPNPAGAQPPGSPAYINVARIMQTRLAGLPVGERLPPERILCEELQVSRVTLRKAMESFHRHGVLETRRGGGTRLARAISAPTGIGHENTRLIGLVVPTFEDPWTAKLLSGVEDVAARNRLHMIFSQTYGEQDNLVRSLRRMLATGVRGIVIHSGNIHLDQPESQTLLRQIAAHLIPVVTIGPDNRSLPNPTVGPDDHAGMYMATKKLLLSGRRRLALLSGGPETDVINDERRDGFLLALQDHHLSPAPVFEACLGDRDYVDAARSVVTAHLSAQGGRARFDGMVAMHDNMAYGAFLALREAGLRVPEHVGIIGYGNLDRDIFHASGLRLTSIDQDAKSIGRETTRLLIARIEGQAKAYDTRRILMKPHMVIRESCGSPKITATSPYSERRSDGMALVTA